MRGLLVFMKIRRGAVGTVRVMDSNAKERSENLGNAPARATARGLPGLENLGLKHEPDTKGLVSRDGLALFPLIDGTRRDAQGIGKGGHTAAIGGKSLFFGHQAGFVGHALRISILT